MSDPAVWQALAKCILERFPQLCKVARPTDVLQMLQRCGDQQLKVKIIEARLKQGETVENALKEFRLDFNEMKEVEG